MLYIGEDKELKIVVRDKNRIPVNLSTCPQIKAVLYFNQNQQLFQRFALNTDSTFNQPIVLGAATGELIFRIRRNQPILSNIFGQVFLEIEIDFPNTNYPNNIFKTKISKVPVFELNSSMIQ